MVLSGTERHFGLDGFFRVQVQDVFVVVKDFMFFQVLQVLLSQQVVSDFDDFIVIVNMTINKCV